MREPTNEQEFKKLLKANRLKPDSWKILWEDYEVLELINRRGRRRTIKKYNCQ